MACACACSNVVVSVAQSAGAGGIGSGGRSVASVRIGPTTNCDIASIHAVCIAVLERSFHLSCA